MRAAKTAMRKQPVRLMKSVPQGHPLPKRRANPPATRKRATAPSAPPRATRRTGVARASMRPTVPEKKRPGPRTIRAARAQVQQLVERHVVEERVGRIRRVVVVMAGERERVARARRDRRVDVGPGVG